MSATHLADDLAEKLAASMVRSSVSPHDRVLIAGLMQSLAPVFKALQDQIDTLEDRIDALER